MTLDFTLPAHQKTRGDAPRNVGAGRLRSDGRGGDGTARTDPGRRRGDWTPAFEFSTSPPVRAISHCRPPERARPSCSPTSPPSCWSARSAGRSKGLTLDIAKPMPALPFGDDEFDAVISAIGVMFAPDHRARGPRAGSRLPPGGTIGVISWTLEGFFGRMLAAISPYRPSVSPAIPMSALWGHEPYARELLGPRVHRVNTRRGVLR